MKPAVFDYVAPSSLPGVLRLLGDDDREVKVLAGGQSLIPMLNMRLARPELLVDITRVAELSELREDDAGRLHIGAAVRQSTAAQAREVQTGWPLLAAAIGHIGHPQIRNRGTICGSLVHHDPAAELPATAIALDAEFVLASGRGRRRVPAAEFFVATFQTAVEPDELLVEVVFPPATGNGWAFAELSRTHGDFATTGVAVSLTRSGSTVDAARIVFCGVGSTPVRVSAAEQALIGGDAGEADRQEAHRRAVAALDPPGDIHASSEYRREVAAVLLDRAILEAWERCHVR
ncbi:xanthine dehydrogenase family protein subunit M [Saccharopolyspora shandongensis]|uniref:FAD binding domain-containing protein n=1 Tax=Saccharopolyspora shandongensis TaxID=418495 RepID=UPI00340E809C